MAMVTTPAAGGDAAIAEVGASKAGAPPAPRPCGAAQSSA
jgi:hypothetical protein